MVFNTTSSNISVISWWSALLVEETGVHGENRSLATSHWQTLSHSHDCVKYSIKFASLNRKKIFLNAIRASLSKCFWNRLRKYYLSKMQLIPMWLYHYCVLGSMLQYIYNGFLHKLVWDQYYYLVLNPEIKNSQKLVMSNPEKSLKIPKGYPK